VPSRLVPIYLDDHLAGATVGVELARRTLRENQGSELGEFLRTLIAEAEEDRATLVGLIRQLGREPSRLKAGAAWATEKVGRLKLNGQLRGYSPLSRLVELEALAAGIEGKRALWLALAAVAERDTSLRRLDYDALAERARSQRERLEPYRLAAAAEALA
jgi:hypothetical protein